MDNIWSLFGLFLCVVIVVRAIWSLFDQIFANDYEPANKAIREHYNRYSMTDILSRRDAMIRGYEPKTLKDEIQSEMNGWLYSENKDLSVKNDLARLGQLRAMGEE